MMSELKKNKTFKEKLSSTKKIPYNELANYQKPSVSKFNIIEAEPIVYKKNSMS